MSFAVAVPTYRRAAVLARKTWPLLLNRGFRREQITVFVADDDELAALREHLPDANAVVLGYKPQPWAGSLPEGPTDLGLARNLIAEHYGPGRSVLHVDDDLTDVRVRVTDKETRPLHDLAGFVKDAFAEADVAGARLWGIYPVSNPYFMRPKVTSRLSYVCGGFYGHTYRGGDADRVTVDDKEDFERSVRCYLADGAVSRWGDVCIGTTGYAGQGGMQETRTKDRVTASAEALVARYPGLVTLNTSKRSGWTEVRLRDRRPHP